MMLDDYPELERRVERLERRATEAKGAIREILKRLKAEFGCATLEEAKKLLKELEEKEREASVKYTKAKQAFEKKYRKELKKA